ncbi:unnamed protein product, partial [marine sediment metagenome]
HVEIQFWKTKHRGQCWNAVGRDAAGNLYLGNSTHRSHSYAYRMDARTRQMRYLGDIYDLVRFGAPGGADNGKIHSSFVEGPDGCMYFLSHYGRMRQIRYGGHLWKYDPKADRILDLGVPAPGNTSFCTTAVDPVRNCIYMMSTPGGLFIRYDFATQSFTALGRSGMNWVRHMPMDRDGNVYVVGEGKVRRFDPVTEKWEVVAENAEPFGPMTGYCWTADRRRLYLLNYVEGRVFTWTPGEKIVTELGWMHPKRTPLYIYNIHLSADETRLFSIGASG